MFERVDMSLPSGIKQIDKAIWEIPVSCREGMRVPARIYATRKLLGGMEEGVFEQICNVAMLPGIVSYAGCMPDGHWGYGFPIGGMAAFDVEDGVISPGGIGFDINCGMRLVRTNLTYEQVQPRLRELIDKLFDRIPAGVGRHGFLRVGEDEFREITEQGARWCVEHGYGEQQDLERTEEGGCMDGADASKVSIKAIQRGYKQVGTLGSGNHYLEIQVVKPENIVDEQLANAFGINLPNQVVVMFHCGSRGFGHQVATDYLELFLRVMNKKYGIKMPDRELSCAPFNSQEGQDYFSAMQCAVNMAFANRQMILHRVREVFCDVFGKDAKELGMEQIYDVSHNTAQVESYDVNGIRRKLLVHRKGATRALGPGNEKLPEVYRGVGQPVIIGGSMETGSYLLAGQSEGAETFFTTAHGSGRVMSRRKAKKTFRGRDLLDKMRQNGIYVRCSSYAGLAEEAGGAYKDIDAVVRAVNLAGISRPVAKFVPVGNIKG